MIYRSPSPSPSSPAALADEPSSPTVSPFTSPGSWARSPGAPSPHPYQTRTRKRHLKRCDIWCAYIHHHRQERPTHHIPPPLRRHLNAIKKRERAVRRYLRRHRAALVETLVAPTCRPDWDDALVDECTETLARAELVAAPDLDLMHVSPAASPPCSPIKSAVSTSPPPSTRKRSTSCPPLPRPHPIGACPPPPRPSPRPVRHRAATCLVTARDVAELMEARDIPVGQQGNARDTDNPSSADSSTRGLTKSSTLEQTNVASTRTPDNIPHVATAEKIRANNIDTDISADAGEDGLDEDDATVDVLCDDQPMDVDEPLPHDTPPPPSPRPSHALSPRAFPDRTGHGVATFGSSNGTPEGLGIRERNRFWRVSPRPPSPQPSRALEAISEGDELGPSSAPMERASPRRSSTPLERESGHPGHITSEKHFKESYWEHFWCSCLVRDETGLRVIFDQASTFELLKLFFLQLKHDRSLRETVRRVKVSAKHLQIEVLGHPRTLAGLGTSASQAGSWTKGDPITGARSIYLGPAACAAMGRTTQLARAVGALAQPRTLCFDPGFNTPLDDRRRTLFTLGVVIIPEWDFLRRVTIHDAHHALVPDPVRDRAPAPARPHDAGLRMYDPAGVRGRKRLFLRDVEYLLVFGPHADQSTWDEMRNMIRDMLKHIEREDTRRIQVIVPFDPDGTVPPPQLKLEAPLQPLSTNTMAPPNHAPAALKPSPKMPSLAHDFVFGELAPKDRFEFVTVESLGDDACTCCGYSWRHS